MPTIDYYYSVMSGFAYLGEPELRRLADAAGISINYRPIDILALFAAIDTVPPARQSPQRRAWRDSELERWARVRGLPVNTSPRHWPIPAAAPSRAVIAAQSLGFDPGPLSFAILSGVWAQDLDLADPGTLGEIVHRIFPDSADRILAAANDQAAETAFMENTKEAIARGVIGSPTFIFNGEMLFGQDRLPFLAQKLESHS